MPVPGRFAGCHRTSDAGSGRFAGCHRTSVAGSGPVRRIPPDVGSPPDVGCRLQPVCRMPSDIGSRFRPVRRMPPDVGCRFAGTPPDVGCRPPAATGTDHCRMPDRRLPPVPITVGCRAAGHHRYRSPSDAGPPVRFVGAAGPVPDALCHRSGFGLSKPLHVARQPPLLVQVTLNSLCSTHRHKDNNFCSTLYIVGALFDLSMWDTS